MVCKTISLQSWSRTPIGRTSGKRSATTVAESTVMSRKRFINAYGTMESAIASYHLICENYTRSAE